MTRSETMYGAMPSLQHGFRRLALLAALLIALFTPALARAQDDDEKPPLDKGDVSVPKGQGGAIIKEKPQADADAVPQKARPPKPTNYVAPDYPPEAKAQGLEADVVLQLDIDAEGKVTNAVVVDPAGNGFDESAIAASKKLKFDPARRSDGSKAAARILYRFTFTLNEAPAVDDPDAPDEPRTVQNFGGTVYAAGGDAPLAGAAVVLIGPDGEAITLATAPDGTFEAADVAEGTYRVTITAPGFEPLAVEEQITLTERTEVKYRLLPQGDGLTVTVRGERPPREVVKRTITKREIDRIPGTNGDALRSIQNLPGVARPPGILGVLLVRGSGPADTQTFIDGTPVPLIYHFGGLSSVVPTEILEKIDFYPGNFSTQYGRVTGGIVDAGIRSPNYEEYHGLVQVDLIDARLLLEGPVPFIEDTGFIVAGRRSYIDAWLGPVLEGAGAGVTQAPVYWDYQFLVEHQDPDAGRFRVSFFGSDDRLELLLDEPNPNEPALSGNVGLATSFQRLQLQYENDLTEEGSLRAVAALGQDDLQFGLGPLFFNLNVKTLTSRFEYSHRFSKEVTVNTGWDIFAGTSEVNLRLPAPQRPGQTPNTPFSSRTLQNLTAEQDFLFPAFYSELELTPHPRLRLVPGVRFDFQSFNDEFAFSPRVNGRYAIVNEFPKTTAKAGIGIFAQPPQFQQVVEPIGTPNLNSNRAIHYALGVEQDITRQIEGSVEGFYKQLDNLVIADPDASGSGNTYKNQGTGRVIGAEVLLRYNPDDRFFGWLAYTLSRSTRTDRPGEEEQLVSFDQTHILTVLGSYKLGGGWEFGARFRLVSGNLIRPNVCSPTDATCDLNRSNALYFAGTGSYTPVPLTDGASERLPLFHQLDVRVDRRWEFESWQLSAYLDIQNIYNNQNTEAVAYNFDFTERTFVSGIPILPSIGLRADF